MKAATALRQARRRTGLSQRELAARAGVPQATVARIERGVVVPRVDTLERLLRACGEMLDALPIEGTGIDRTLFEGMLRLSPAERIYQAAVEGRNLDNFLAAARR